MRHLALLIALAVAVPAEAARWKGTVCGTSGRCGRMTVRAMIAPDNSEIIGRFRCRGPGCVAGRRGRFVGVFGAVLAAGEFRGKSNTCTWVSLFPGGFLNIAGGEYGCSSRQRGTINLERAVR